MIGRDTPIEILHTVLLGIVAHAWADTVKRLNVVQRNHVLAWMYSNDWNGTPHKTKSNAISNFRSFQGRDFKIIVKFVPFMLDLAGVDIELVVAWCHVCSVSLLCVDHVDIKRMFMCSPAQQFVRFLFSPSISRIWIEAPMAKEYCTQAVTDIYHFETVKARSKGHSLVHAFADILHCGPLVNVITEAFEGMNKHCRKRFQFSNNQAPGRDTARDFAKIDATNFVLRGGYWRQDHEGK